MPAEPVAAILAVEWASCIWIGWLIWRKHRAVKALEAQCAALGRIYDLLMLRWRLLAQREARDGHVATTLLRAHLNREIEYYNQAVTDWRRRVAPYLKSRDR